MRRIYGEPEWKRVFGRVCKQFSSLGLRMNWMETPRIVENRWKSCDFSGLTVGAERYSFIRFVYTSFEDA